MLYSHEIHLPMPQLELKLDEILSDISITNALIGECKVTILNNNKNYFVGA